MTRLALAAVLLLAPALARAQDDAPVPAPPVDAAPGAFVGPERCAECHKPQFEVWKASKHAVSFKTVHREATAPDILIAAGGDRGMKRNATCLNCHYTPAPGGTGEVIAGVSCEHCHGPASGWLKTHQDYGGKRDAETPEHKAARQAAAAKAGMVYPHDLYALATRCVECHGLLKPGVDGGTLAKMVHANHPMNYNYELVRYSQGTVRHRFYPPRLDVNAEMSPEELARLWVIGQAAKAAAAQAAVARAQDPAYKKIAQRQLEAARAELGRVKDVPEAASFLAHPSPEAGEALAKAIADKDLTPQVKDRLPKSKSEYR
ncbi:MAG TPA: cytochrome c family protein [Elusimicrobiota bacterium]|nr:cytochrome c family protein [Elusimicrobiota bacterium]